MSQGLKENPNYLVTFKFYDTRGRRLSIFGERVGTDQLKVTVITCSKRDAFCKRVGRGLYERIVAGSDCCSPDSTYIAVAEGKFKQTFILWCKSNYCKLAPIRIEFQEWVLFGPNGKPIDKVYEKLFDAAVAELQMEQGLTSSTGTVVGVNEKEEEEINDEDND